VRRSIVALASAAMLLSVVVSPVAAVATPMGEIDQSNPTTGDIATMVTAGQTFTPAVTGQLTQVDLWAEWAGSPLAVGQAAPNPAGGIGLQIYATAGGLPIGTALGGTGGAAIVGPGWVSFTLSPAIPVLAGTMYAFSFSPGTDTGVFVGTAYSRGTALTYGGSAWSKNTARDYAFQTYVYAQYTSVSWSQGQVLAGSSTTVTLTETFHFPAMDVGAVGATWALVTPTLPTWFTPTGVVCSATIGDCDIAHLASDKFMPVPHTATPLIVTVTITGTAAPLVADLGTTGTGTGEGCSVAVSPQASPDGCIDASADILVVDHITTPPPGTTSLEPVGEGGSGTWLMPGAIIGLLFVAFTLNRRRLLER
jgi:hypothetical protein